MCRYLNNLQHFKFFIIKQITFYPIFKILGKNFGYSTFYNSFKHSSFLLNKILFCRGYFHFFILHCNIFPLDIKFVKFFQVFIQSFLWTKILVAYLTLKKYPCYLRFIQHRRRMKTPISQRKWLDFSLN